MPHKIAWEKWYDIIEEEVEQEVEENEEWSDKEEPEGIMFGPDMFELEKINTPLGEYNINDRMLPTKLFDCWICHTNFAITKKELDILNNIPGIECLKIMSKYRFFIGIGRLFDFSDVRAMVQSKLCSGEEEIIIPETPFQNLGSILTGCSDKKRWAVYLGKNGSIESIACGDGDSVEEYEKRLSELKALVDGNLITFQDV